MRAKGWLEDAAGAAPRLPLSIAANPRYGAPSARPSALAYRGKRLYQGRANSCVAFALARAIRISQASQAELAGVTQPPPTPSPWHIYYNARAIEHAGIDPDKAPPLADVGSYPRLAVEALKRFGFCEWSFAPYNAELVNEHPPNCAYRRAIDQAGLQWFSLDGHHGTTRADVVRQCYQQRPVVPVVFGMTIDRAFEDWRGGAPINRVDEARETGRHMMTVVEVLPDDNLLIDNWWDGWGTRDGFGVITPELFGSKFVRNVYAVLPVPFYA